MRSVRPFIFLLLRVITVDAGDRSQDAQGLFTGSWIRTCIYQFTENEERRVVHFARKEDPLCIGFTIYDGHNAKFTIRTAMPASELPKECSIHRDGGGFFIPTIKLSLKRFYGVEDLYVMKTKMQGALPNEYIREKEILELEGALFCCGVNFCNDEAFSFFRPVRMIIENDPDRNWTKSLPLVIVFGLITIMVWPCVSQIHEENRSIAEDKTERAALMDHDELFDHIEVFHEKPEATGHLTVAKISKIIKKLGVTIEEVSIMDLEEIVVQPMGTIHFADKFYTRPISRRIYSKHRELAYKLIEHGPYEYAFTVNELSDLMDDINYWLDRQPTVLHLNAGYHVIGNLNGNYMNLFRWLNIVGWPPRTKLLFLGGLTQKDEKYSLETLALILALKKCQPHCVHILRGVSECRSLELHGRFSHRINRCLQVVIKNTLAKLPLAAVIAENVLCVHGGVPRDLRLDEIATDANDADVESTAVADLIFSVPNTKAHKTTGGRGYHFTADDVAQFLEKNNLKMLLRARNPSITGSHMSPNGKVMTLWSAPGAQGALCGATAEITTDGKIGIIKLTHEGKQKLAMTGIRFTNAKPPSLSLASKESVTHVPSTEPVSKTGGPSAENQTNQTPSKSIERINGGTPSNATPSGTGSQLHMSQNSREPSKETSREKVKSGEKEKEIKP